MIHFKVNNSNSFCIIQFDIDDGFSPAGLYTLYPPDPVAQNFANKGVILSGRGPVWLYCFLTHFYHPTKFVATYDPRLEGAVIIETHSDEYMVGHILPVDSSLVANAIPNH